MSRKGHLITLSLREQEKQQLEKLALELGCLWGDRPNTSNTADVHFPGKVFVHFCEV